MDQFQLKNGNGNDLLNTLSAYDLVIVGYHTNNASPWKGYKPTAENRSFLKKLSLQNKFVLSLFSNPYVLGSLPEAELANGLIMSYQNNWESNQAAAELKSRNTRPDKWRIRHHQFHSRSDLDTHRRRLGHRSSRLRRPDPGKARHHQRRVPNLVPTTRHPASSRVRSASESN